MLQLPFLVSLSLVTHIPGVQIPAVHSRSGPVHAAARPRLGSAAGRLVLPASALAAAGALAAASPAVTLAASAAASGEAHLHLGQKIALFFQQTGLPDWAVLMLISALPAVELRGGVPVGNWMGISPYATLAICVVGNMVPLVPLFLALRSQAVKSLLKPLLARAEKKLAGLPTGQSRWLALTLFVGVPAPGTGGWTGAIIGYLLGMGFGEAMSAIVSGVILAGVIMTILTLAGKVGALIALGALVLFGVGAIATAKD
mmetsp:Transcript_34975/g.115933  ORF Transcript_34975/g.115933 Transcript_34975/m.115933 type:complete len:258 (-) Transcript_34975:179-952(-)